ncbi:MAG: SDR family oxidoreductase [Myxococcales bacterium]|nr:SDR family oxidoreductase [Myxococcales bacterium]MCB9735115.1 SDR family oxidoreductase [Deltaproteobacteria bacterium]
MGRLTDKVAIITGAAGGIGAAAARLFVAEGARVMLADVAEPPLRDLVASLGDAADYQICDVSTERHVQDLVAATVARFGGVDVLFANAGVEGRVAPLLEQSTQDLERVLHVNLFGVWYGIKHAAPELARRGGGAVVVTSSVAGLVGSAGLGPYIASKHAVLGLVKTAAIELAPLRIRVNAVNPGPIANRMMHSIEAQAAPDAPAAVRAGFEQLVPLHRYGTNEEVAHMAAFLASDDASYCTGGAYLVDGGFVAG